MIEYFKLMKYLFKKKCSVTVPAGINCFGIKYKRYVSVRCNVVLLYFNFVPLNTVFGKLIM